MNSDNPLLLACRYDSWTTWSDDRVERSIYSSSSSGFVRLADDGRVRGISFDNDNGDDDEQLVWNRRPTSPAPTSTSFALNPYATAFVPRGSYGVSESSTTSSPEFDTSSADRSPSLRVDTRSSYSTLDRFDSSYSSPSTTASNANIDSPGAAFRLIDLVMMHQQQLQPSIQQQRYRAPPGIDPEPWCTYCRKKSTPDWANHKELRWDTGEYQCRRLLTKVQKKMAKDGIRPRCEYCTNAAPHEAETHWRACPITKRIMCPLMRSLPACKKCGAIGDRIHTLTRCPRRPDLESELETARGRMETKDA